MNHPNSRKLPHKMADRPDGSVEMNGFIFDRDWAEMFCWIPFHDNGNGYACHHSGGPKEYLHRIILNAPKKMHIDHINHNTKDNRRSNLRIVTPSVNARNTRKKDFTGVHFDNGRYVAKIWFNRRGINLGSFKTIEEARSVKNAAEENIEPYRHGGISPSEEFIDSLKRVTYTRAGPKAQMVDSSINSIKQKRGVVWRSRVYKNNKPIDLGIFLTREEAVEARRKYLIENGYRILGEKRPEKK